MQITAKTILEKAAEIQLADEISAIMQRFFKEVSTRVEQRRLDEWVEEDSAHEEFFLLVAAFARHQSFEEAVEVLAQTARR
ncbi:hypothetical protein [Flavihumibacter petaseus]|uniref:Uncharacterized protein n=1 Tax=Flavihumibacter petaseus NBRC 106054 TaxID=1220578 RepID=A0A0E9N645_9BACT|nr:hypothetical protein [Flavihumibacter petaseus]GAO45392.1 hypothetical protein FPE01S_05_00870 [Flavihumibacter petaseus NBRC 106054]